MTEVAKIDEPLDLTQTVQEKPEFLTKEQIEELCDVFVLPFNNLKIVLERINEDIRILTRILLSYVKIYPKNFNVYKEHLRKKFLSSLIDPNMPIGAITSDAIGQQATQALLNTIHSIGTAKSGGPDGIKENIGISPNRKILYSIIHFRDGTKSFEDIVKMKKKFIALSLNDLLSETPKSLIVNINKELNENPFTENISEKEKKKIFQSNSYWWYVLSPFDNEIQGKRKCLRLKFDVQKLYENKLLTSEIATFINKWKFEITIPKKFSGANNKREVEKIYVFAVPSPTHIGIVDIFIKNPSDEKDDLLISLIHGNEFKNMIISGIGGINNFYAVNTKVLRLLKSVEETNRFEEEEGKKGMWIYLEDNRFTGIPYHRIFNIFDKIGIKYELPYYTHKDSYKNDCTDLPFEYVSHKGIKENRKYIKLKAYILGNMDTHHHPYYFSSSNTNGEVKMNTVKNNLQHYTYKNTGKGFEVAIYPYGQTSKVEGMLANKKFKDKNSLANFLNHLDQKIDLQIFSELFPDKVEENKKFFEERDKHSKLISFEVESDPNGNYLIYHMFQIKYLVYELHTNLDYINSQHTVQSLNSVLDLHFSIPYKVANQGGNIIPEIFRRYKIIEDEKITRQERRILIKSKMFLTNKYDYLGMENRDIILQYVNHVQKDMSKENKVNLVKNIANKDLSDDEIETIISQTMITPHERLLEFISKNCNEKDLSYVFAETSGSNFSELIKHKDLLGNRVLCNHFHQVYEAYGLESLRNLLDYDLIGMINGSGHIDVEYMNLLTNVTTHNGINQMTSEGISCQKRSVIDTITFDNAPKRIHDGAVIGEKQFANSTSACILLGKNFKLGTGGVIIDINKSKLLISSTKKEEADNFLKLLGTEKPVGNMFLTEEEDEEPIYIPKIVCGKFPPVSWIIDSFVQKDLYYMIKQGINRFKTSTFHIQKIKKYRKTDNFKNILFDVKPRLISK